LSASTPHSASNSPAAPPINDRSTLSVSSWRASRQRLAPSASRIETSGDLSVARESDRFAMLAQAMIKTNVVTNISRPSASP
jgi:hypothetical protein